MEKSLQALNHQEKLAVWSERVAACRSSGISVRAKKPRKRRSGSFASPSAIAHLAVQKYVMYSPLYRLEQEFDRQGLKLSRQTMSNWLLTATEDWLQPIYDVLHQQLRKEKVLHGDETTLQVLHEKGKSATSKSYMWIYRTSGCAEHPIVLYEYQPNRKVENAEQFLEGFSGWLHADGYQGYHRLPENIRVVGCWAHARRKFEEALTAVPKEQQSASKPAEIAYANGDMSRREFDLNYSGYVVDFFPRFEQEHPLLARRFADTIDRTYDDCSWMPDDRFQDAISAAVDKFMGNMSKADLS